MKVHQAGRIAPDSPTRHPPFAAPAGKKTLPPAIKAQLSLAAFEKKPGALVHHARDHVHLPANLLGVLDTEKGANALKRARLAVLST